jgi:hypothetical protein
MSGRNDAEGEEKLMLDLRVLTIQVLWIDKELRSDEIGWLMSSFSMFAGLILDVHQQNILLC